MLESLRRAGVRLIKPRVSERRWAALRAADPRRLRERETPLSEQPLSYLSSHFGTDKWGVHRYAKHYERHLEFLKHEHFTLFEIGIGGYASDSRGGASLRTWKQFFPNAQIIGLDLEDKSFVDEARIQTFQGSQTNEPLLRTIVETADNLQVIIDDGSHRSEHVRETFRILFPMLPEGGIYIIEDTQTSYWPSFGGSPDLTATHTTMALVKSLVDGLNWEEYNDPASYQPTVTEAGIVAVHCYHNLVVIEKGRNREGTLRPVKYR